MARRSVPLLGGMLASLKGLLRVVLSLFIHIPSSMKAPYGCQEDFFRKAAVLGLPGVYGSDDMKQRIE